MDFVILSFLLFMQGEMLGSMEDAFMRGIYIGTNN